MKPLIKYAGGKTRIAPFISTLLPPCTGTWREPFAGSAAVTLYRAAAGELLGPIVLGDLDAGIVNLHRSVIADPDAVCAALAAHRVGEWTEARYLALRRKPETAARLITLNKTCFNGLYRRNQSGQFNAPWGDRPNPSLPTDEEIRTVARLLSGARVEQRDAVDALEDATAGDQVYLDSPYVDTWTGYGQGTTYTLADLERLIRAATRAVHRGATVVLSHLDSPDVRGLLSDWSIAEVNARASISRSAKGRGVRREILAVLGAT